MSECRTPDIVELEMEAESLFGDDGNVEESVMPENVIDITDDLINILDTLQPIFPNDLLSIINILDAIIL